MTKKAPTDAATQFLICEAVRQEQGGKLSLLGLFPDGKILVPPETKKVTLPLVCVFIFQDGVGSFSSKVSVIAPSGAFMVNDEPFDDVEKRPDGPFIALVHIMPFQTEEFGTFTVRLRLDENSYKRTFTIYPRKPD